jgi:hypothetical protein
MTRGAFSAWPHSDTALTVGERMGEFEKPMHGMAIAGHSLLIMLMSTP